MHLYLVGYRGSGKSTVARLMAARLQLPLWDTDRMVEASAGKSIRAIFEQEGEPAFRELEHLAVAELASRSENEPAVVSLGGGAILREDNRDLLRRSGRCIWLTGSAKVLYERILGDTGSQQTRPRLTDRDDYAEIVEVLSIREPIYRQLANLTLDTDSRSPDELTEAILLWVES